MIYRVYAYHTKAGMDCEPMNVRAGDEPAAREEYLARCVQPRYIRIEKVELAPKGARPTKRERLDS